jgi:RNA ligase (TIGR02306 family)
MNQNLYNNGMKNLATVESVSEIRPHPNADKLELAGLEGMGWQVVVKKGEYKVGDIVVFVKIDSLVPRIPETEFLFKDEKEQYARIKMMKLRGEVSQGLILPLSVIPDGKYVPSIDAESHTIDVTGILGVKKYSKTVPINMAGQVNGQFPTYFLPKSDEVNLLSEPKILDEFYELETIVATIKYDGSSCTFGMLPSLDGGGMDFVVCSRNLMLKRSDENIFWKTATSFGVEEKIRGLGYPILFQGELVGPGIQKNPLKLDTHNILVFNAVGVGRKQYGPIELFDICSDLGLDCVVQQCKYLTFEKKFASFSFFESMAKKFFYSFDDKTKVPAEGMVVRPIVPRESRVIGRPLSFKVLNPNYKDN